MTKTIKLANDFSEFSHLEIDQTVAKIKLSTIYINGKKRIQ